MKTNPTTGIVVLLSLFVLFPSIIFAQTASTLCLEEMLACWRKVDLEFLSQKPDPTGTEFRYSYLHSENKAPVVQKIRVEAGAGQSRYMGPEQWIISDGKETFTWFPDRFIIYRTNARLADRFLVKEIPSGLFKKGIVTDCEYIPHTGNDTLAWKKYRFFANEEAKKEYGINKIEFVIDPWDTLPISMRIDFEPGQLLVWALYEFGRVEIPLGEWDYWEAPANFVLDGEGKPKPLFRGAKLFDYRKGN